MVNAAKEMLCHFDLHKITYDSGASIYVLSLESDAKERSAVLALRPSQLTILLHLLQEAQDRAHDPAFTFIRSGDV